MKLAGGFLIVVSLVMTYKKYTRHQQKKMEQIRSFVYLIRHIRQMIDCYAMPLSDILASADPAVLAACLGLDMAGHPPPALAGDRPITSMVEESRLYLEPETERLLTTLTGELGSTYRAEQVARCDHYLRALTEERRKLGDSLPARLRAVCTLCLCSAVVAALLLW